MKNFNIDKDVSRGSKKTHKYYTKDEIKAWLDTKIWLLAPKFKDSEAKLSKQWNEMVKALLNDKFLK
jgi:hypothetical protein